MSDMIFEKSLKESKSPVSIIPYVKAITSKDYENKNYIRDIKFGRDAKLTIVNNLNLNSHSSQIYIDQQVTNLTRFEISLSERRQFFIEMVIFLLISKTIETPILSSPKELALQKILIILVFKMILLPEFV
jgi:hypothetical protein